MSSDTLYFLIGFITCWIVYTSFLLIDYLLNKLKEKKQKV